MVPLPPYYFEVVVVNGVVGFGYYDDEWVRDPSGVLCIFHQRSCRFPYVFIITVSKRSVVDMVSKLTSKVAAPSRTSWSPPRTKTLWSPKVMPSIGINVGTLPVMMNT